MNLLILIMALIIARQAPVTINITITPPEAIEVPQDAQIEPQKPQSGSQDAQIEPQKPQSGSQEPQSESQAQAESFNGYSAEDIDLLARVVQAEAGGEDETGKRLIVSVILNRVRSDLPDFVAQTTVQSVISAPNQFVIAGWASAECYDAVYKELLDPTDPSVLWFASTGFQPYGTPLYQHGGHFFNGE